MSSNSSMIDRAQYEDEWANWPTKPERLYGMPLVLVSDTIYRVMPPVSGLNY